MAWEPSRSRESIGGRESRRQVVTLGAWGLVAMSSFVAAFMALQFSKFDEAADETAAAEDPVKAAPAGTASGIGIIQLGSDAARSSRTDELATDVESLRKELVALRRTVASIRESRDQLALRLAAVEETYQGFTSSIAKTARTKSPAPRDVTPAAAPAEAPVAAPATPPMPPVPIAAPQQRKAASGQRKASADAALTTGSIPADPQPAAAGGPAGAERTDFAVDLGGFSSLATLAKGWSDLREQQKELLGDLAPRASLSDKDGRLEVRLVAGPFANAAHAITLCAQLQARGRPCQPTLFVGQPVAAE